MHEPLLQPFRIDPKRAGLFLDFDGTLSEIVEDPAAARPVPDVPELLEALAHDFGVVSIVSGRSANELAQWLGDAVEIWGVHGAQRAHQGEIRFVEQALPHKGLMEKVRLEANRRVEELDLPGVIVEDKGVMVVLHYRNAADVECARSELDRLADDLAARYELKRVPGRQMFELQPPAEFSKAAVITERTKEESLKAVMFVGDDRVDLPGFDALDLLAEDGLATARVAVRSDEAPAELLERADLVVDGPQGVVELLRSLLPAG